MARPHGARSTSTQGNGKHMKVRKLVAMGIWSTVWALAYVIMLVALGPFLLIRYAAANSKEER
jgi:hypothetical protein